MCEYMYDNENNNGKHESEGNSIFSCVLPFPINALSSGE